MIKADAMGSGIEHSQIDLVGGTEFAEHGRNWPILSQDRPRSCRIFLIKEHFIGRRLRRGYDDVPIRQSTRCQCRRFVSSREDVEIGISSQTRIRSEPT